MEKKHKKRILVIVKHKATDKTTKNKKIFAWEIAEDLIRSLNGSLYKRKFSDNSIRELNNLFGGIKPLILDYIEIRLQKNNLYKQEIEIYNKKLNKIIK